MLGFKNFLMEEDGVGVVEMVLIVVVLICCVVQEKTDNIGFGYFYHN